MNLAGHFSFQRLFVKNLDLWDICKKIFNASVARVERNVSHDDVKLYMTHNKILSAYFNDH